MLPIGSSGDSQASSGSDDLVLIHSLPSVGNLLSQGVVFFSSELIAIELIPVVLEGLRIDGSEL